MKVFFQTILVIAFLAIVGGDAFSASPEKEYKGVAYASYWHDEFCSAESDGRIKEIAMTGANYIQIVPTLYQKTINSNEIEFDLLKTTNVDCLIQAIENSKKEGLKIFFKPHVDSFDGLWRGKIQPTDSSAWFESYESWMIACAEFAEFLQIEVFCLGTELVNMTEPQHVGKWEKLIDNVRAVYSGKLIYAADVTELSQITFWDKLDLIGVNAYFQLTQKTDPNVLELFSGLKKATGEALDLLGDASNPIIFTEIGFRSIDGANIQPSYWQQGGTVDLQEQADCYEATALALVTDPRIDGLFWWTWRPVAGNQYADDYTPRGKPAEKILTDWFSGEDFVDQLGGFEIWVEGKIKNETKEYPFVVNSKFNSKSGALSVLYETYSQSMSDYTLNSVKIEILRGLDVILKYTDSYESQSSWGKINPEIREKVFKNPGITAGEELSIRITVKSGDYVNWISRFAVVAY